MIKIIIDNREKQLYTNIKERDLDIYKDKIEINVEQLDIGDIHIYFSYNDNNYLYIYERKTSNDLISSIKDGRYKEQKLRLKASNAISINYLIEGDSITSIKNKNNDNTANYIDNCKIKTEKNKNIDKYTCYLLQLSQIPSISKEIAKNISSIYPSLSILLKTLNDSDDKIGLLMKIDKIGKTKAITIINYLL